MKKILLAKKGKRLLSRFIDFLIVISLTLFIFLLFVFPNCLNREKINENAKEITELYKGSGLFIVDEDGNYVAKSGFQNVKSLNDLYQVNCEYKQKVYQVKLVESLYTYYTSRFVQYGGQNNLSLDTFKKDILKVGSKDSNIKEFNEISFQLILMQEDQEEVTVAFFLSVYSSACRNLISNSKIQSLTQENQTLFLQAFILLLPVLIGVSFIFDFLIPLFSPASESIGKYIFKLGVISKKGYKLNKLYLIPRWIGYVAIELILGIFTIGGFTLISYTMFLFTKNRRCLHDFIAGTVVIDKTGSIYFASPKEESFYLNRKKIRGEA